MSTPNTKGLPKRFPRRAPKNGASVILDDYAYNPGHSTFQVFEHDRGDYSGEIDLIDIREAERLIKHLQTAVAEARKRGLK